MEKKRKNNHITSLKMTTTFVLLLSTATISLFGCHKGHTKMIEEESLEDVLTTYQDDTSLDDIVALDEYIGVKENDTIKDVRFIDAVNRVEDYLLLLEEIDELKLKESEKECDDDTKESLHNLTKEEVESLISSYNDENIKFIEKARTSQQLNYLSTYYENFINENGEIIEALLKRAIKEKVCEISGLSYTDYNCCSISPDSILGREITVSDQESGESIAYKVGSSSGLLNDMMDTLYKVQDSTKNIELAKTALTLVKDNIPLSYEETDTHVIVPMAGKVLVK